MAMIGFLDLDADTAGHLAVAVHLHIRSLEDRGRVVPPALPQIRDIAHSAATKGHEGSAGIARRDVLEAEPIMWLSAADVAHELGVSASTVKR